MKSFLRYFVVSLFGASGFIANAQKPATALQMNDHLTAITDSLYDRGVQWGRTFNSAYKTKDFSSLAPLRKKLEVFIDKKRKEVITLPDINGSEELRLAVLDFLAFELAMTKEAFAPLEKLNSNSSDEEIKKALEKLREHSSEEDILLQKVVKAQEAYAAKNRLAIEKPDESDEHN
jgi:hypothetical protein